MSLFALLAIFISACSSPRAAKPAAPQMLGDIAVSFLGYKQNGGWQAVFLATNTATTKIESVALSYAAGLPQGSKSVVAEQLDARSLPADLVWNRREPEVQIDPLMLQRYGIGHVFELQPGEQLHLLLPIFVPQAHPHDFVEHFVFGYKRTAPNGEPEAYEFYIAEIKR